MIASMDYQHGLRRIDTRDFVWDLTKESLINPLWTWPGLIAGVFGGFEPSAGVSSGGYLGLRSAMAAGLPSPA